MTDLTDAQIRTVREARRVAAKVMKGGYRNPSPILLRNMSVFIIELVCMVEFDHPDVMTKEVSPMPSSLRGPRRKQR